MFSPRKEHFGFQVSIDKDKLGVYKKDNNNNYIFQYSYHVFAPPIKAVILSGGGGRTTVYVALLEKIENNRETIELFGGSSAGAFFSVFAAIPLEPGEIRQVLSNIEISKDILPQATWAKLYKIIMSPLNLISKPLSIIGNFFEYLSEEYLSKKKVGMKILSTIMLIIAYVLKIAGMITHPVFLVAIYNLIFKGGIIRGAIFQSQLRAALLDNTKLALERFISRIPNDQREKIIQHILSIKNLVKNINEKSGKIEVIMAAKYITYKHFHELSRIENSGFKSVFTIAVLNDRSREKKIEVFNHINHPDDPLDEGVLYSISLPYVYMRKNYMDGACMNNIPMEHVHLGNQSTTDYLHSYFRGIHGQDLRILGVSVEDKKGMLSLHIAKKQSTSLLHNIEKNVIQWLTGVDIIGHSDRVTQNVRDLYPLRLLQLYDHKIKTIDFMVDPVKREKAIQSEKKRVDKFFALHNEDELVHLEIFNSLSIEHTHINTNTKCMPLALQKKFLHFLQNTTVPYDKIIINLPSDVNVANLQKQIITQLQNNLAAANVADNDLSSSQSMIKPPSTPSPTVRQIHNPDPRPTSAYALKF